MRRPMQMLEPTRRRKTNRQHGFTLVELLIAISLTIILVGVVAVIFEQVGRVSRTSLAQIDAARQVNAALSQIEEDLRRYEHVVDAGLALEVREQTLLVGTVPHAADQIIFPARTGIGDQLVRVDYRVEPSGDLLRLVRAVTTITVDLAGTGFTLTGAEDVQPIVDRLTSFDIQVLDPRNAPTPAVSVLRAPTGTEANLVTPPTVAMTGNSIMAGVVTPPPSFDEAAWGFVAIQGGSRPVLVVDRLAPPNDDDVRMEGLPSGFVGQANLVGFAEPPALAFHVQAQLPRFARGTMGGTRLVGLR